MKDATIKIVAIKSKKNEKNEVPIYIRGCYKNKQKTKFTNVWVSEKNFNKDTERIASKEPNSVLLNKCIQEQKQAILDRLDCFISQGVAYTLSDLFVEDKIENKNELNVILKNYFNDRRSKYNTKQAFIYAVKAFEEFLGHSATLQDVTKRSMIDWMNWMLDVRGFKNNSVRNFMNRVQAVVSYATENEMITPNENPFLFNNFIKRISAKTKHKALTEQQLDLVKEYFLSYYEVDVNTLAYRMVKKVRHTQLTNEFIAIRFFLIMFYLQGLSPADILTLKKSQFKEEKSEGKFGEEVWNIELVDVYRLKTGVKVNISFEKNIITSMLMDSYLQSNDGDYFLPFLNDPTNRNGKRMNSYISNLNSSLKIALKKVNDIIDERQLEVQKINVDEISIYSARHTFASVAIHKGITIQQLASMMGRSMEYISTYIQDFTLPDEVRQARQNTIDLDI